MDIRITEHVIRTIIVAPEGRVDAFSVPDLAAQFETYLSQGASQFIVDLSPTTFLDSAGIAALVSLLKKARQKGGDVKLVWPKLTDAQRILRLTKFDRVFAMFDSAEKALEQ